MVYLAAAYIVVFVVLIAYTLALVRRRRNLQREIEMWRGRIEGERRRGD
jgi:CcmD family protein